MLTAWLALCTPAIARADSPAVTVIRDSEAGVDQLPHAVPGNVLAECPQGQAPSSDCYDPDAAAEPAIAVNPADPANVISVYQQGRISSGGDAGNGYSVTFDGGQTWTDGNFPHLTAAAGGPYERSSDPVVAFLPDGSAIATGDAVNFGAGSPTAIATWHSLDGGLHWKDPVLITVDVAHLPGPEPLAVDDKSWIAVDLRSGPGHHLGRVYVTWFRLGCQVCTVNAAYSDDEGATWQTGPAGTGFVVEPVSEAISLPFVLPNGDLAVLAEDNLEAQATSTDRIRIDLAPGAGAVPTGGNLLFTSQHQVAVQRFNFPRQLAEADYSLAATVDANTDSAAPNGRIYAVWADSSMRSDLVNDAFLSRSDDGGSTWTTPVRVNGGPTNDNVGHLAATPAVLEDGTVLVGYRLRQESAASDGSGSSLQVNTMVQVSRDHGATFGSPMKVNTVVDDVGFAAVSHGGPFLGDYDQIAASGGCAYIARAEPIRLTAAEAEQMPPVFHHSRVYVGAVGESSCAIPGVSVADAHWVPALAIGGISIAVCCLAARRRRTAGARPVGAG